ncbi:MAG: hypothetical protein D6801_04945, partial [Alphaproteobacteria bacterium]
MTGLIVHLGAHRTGTTALQRSLKRNAGKLARAGIALWGPAETRAEERSYFYLPENGRFDAPAREAFAAELGATPARRLAISEENILGSMRRNLLKQRFYAGAGARLEAYAQLFGAAPERIGLGLRDYGSYWTSAYGFLLRSRDMPAFEALKPGLLVEMRGWLDIVSDIRRVFPASEIMVWPLEGVRGRLAELIAALLDVPAEGLTALDRPINRS